MINGCNLNTDITKAAGDIHATDTQTALHFSTVITDHLQGRAPHKQKSVTSYEHTKTKYGNIILICQYEFPVLFLFM